MAAATVLSYPQTNLSNDADLRERRSSMDSILGTMAAEGEFPSDQILTLMDGYANGQLTHEKLVEAMFANARRTAHEATSGRPAL